MKKNKIKSLIILVALIPALIACGKTDNKKESESTQLPNPTVEVTQDGEFTTKLGINIDTTKFDTDVTRSIIGDKIAQVVMTKADTEGNDVEVTLRATKDSSVADNMPELLAGIYDNNMSEAYCIEIDNNYYDSISVQSSDANNCEIYSFIKDDTYYTLVVGNGLSQMTIAAILDNVAEAVQ